MNYCVDCKDYSHRGVSRLSTCTHPKHTREPAKDPVSGEPGFRETGGKFTTERYRLCSHIRDDVDEECSVFQSAIMSK